MNTSNYFLIPTSLILSPLQKRKFSGTIFIFLPINERFMDTKLNNKNRKILKLIRFLWIIPVLFICGFFLKQNKKVLNVPFQEVTIRTVENTVFEDYLILHAKVEPLQIQLINVIESGSVEEIYVENGSLVKKGDVLVKLTNPNTALNYITQETNIIEQINQLTRSQTEFRTRSFNLSNDLLSLEHEFTKTEQQYKLHKNMFQEGILAKKTWDETQENYRFQQEKKKLLSQSIEKEKIANSNQLSLMQESLQSMQKSLELLRNNKNNFLIKASLDGVLTSFEPVVGKNYNQGESIGKIAVQKGFKLVAEVDEFYLEKISYQQEASIDFQNQKIALSVTKIVPEVKNGKFLVELNFSSDKALELRQGLSFSVHVNLSEKTKTLAIPKGKFLQETQGKWIFVLKGNRAEKRNIETGRKNPLYIEVITGLHAGEKVITSTYKNFKQVDELQMIQE
jgi:HlyD family secretion protein